jgi:uncharacterized protein YlxW (UPF0749 family)
MPEPGPDLLRRTLLARPGRGQVVVTVLLFTLGVAGATQVRSQQNDDAYTGLRQADLIRAFDGISTSTDRAEKEIDRLKADRDDLKGSTTSRQSAIELARQERTSLSILAGTVPVSGSGIRITINDPDGQVSAGVILDMVQELRATGAEAMEFNDRVRVVAQTSFEETAAGIEVGGELVEAPYVIDVIGEPSALDGALDFPFGPVERVEDAHGTLTTKRLDQVLVESVAKARQPGFAVPDDAR